ncbi:toxin-antitoxin system YwqK family antitoxin [Marinobacter shengliensis]|uniref:toxin-antitoxin system YwqK family antitoxin n=1 Tax=Marinobacter shengliensis TaxID=1389223 RepID=UPI001107E8CB|nr:hypothetical protein [Marinobacter shengliensis]
MMNRRLVFILLLLPLFVQAGQRVWLQEDWRYFDGADPDDRRAKYLELPFAKEGERYRVVVRYPDGQLALEGQSLTPEFNRYALLGGVREYYPDGQLARKTHYVPRDDVCNCGRSTPVEHGESEEYFPNGQLKRKVTYYGGGLVDGDYQEFDSEGRVVRAYTMKSYRKQGLYTEYRGGRLVLEEQYVNGRRQGIQKSYYPDGALKRIYFVGQHFEPEGEDRTYSEVGLLKRNVMRVLDDSGREVERREEHYGEAEQLRSLHHKKPGWELAEEYDENGNLVARKEEGPHGYQGLFIQKDWRNVITAHYVDGVLHGRFVETSSGEERVEGNYEHGKKTGLWLSVARDGSREEARYENGKLHGLMQVMDADGIRRAYITYKNDEKHGPADHETESGNRVVTSYHEGEPDGDYLEYTRHGRLIEKAHYRRGNLHGAQYSFDREGRMASKRSYRNGVPHGEFLETGDFGQHLFSLHYDNGERVGEGSFYMDLSPDSGSGTITR